jgi:uncharacterized protein YggT (Ycf19 family)
MFGLGLIPFEGGIFHLVIAIVFDVLLLAMFVWVLASWFIAMMPQAGGSSFIRLLDAMIAPFVDPIRKRVPQSSVGMLAIGSTVAFIFAWWSLRVLAGLILQGLPGGW